MWDAIAALDQRVQAALIAAVVGLLAGFVGPVVKHWLDRWGLRHRLSTEYQYEERRKLRGLIGNYHGRVLELAERLNHRLWNLQNNEAEGWLRLDGEYTRLQDSYYFTTTVHRVVALLALFRDFQSKAIYIDARIAEKTDLLFLKYAKALEWSLTDVDLFEGLDYDRFHATDHIFSGNLHVICERCLSDGSPLSLRQFQEVLSDGSNVEELRPILQFFDGLCVNELRLRWSRMVVFHLLLMAFINSFGYDIQHTSEDKMQRISASVRQPEVLRNLRTWLGRLGLAESESGKALSRAIRAAKTMAPQ